MMKTSLKRKMIIAGLKLTRFPVLSENPVTGKWYRFPLEGCVSSEGKAVHACLRKGNENKLVILFFGGGVSWNEYMAARPMSIYGNRDETAFYGCGDSALAADLTVRIGLHFLSGKDTNPFRGWNMLAIPYTTGDFHCGTGDFSYTDLDGTVRILHHHGYTNYRAALKEALKVFGGNPEQILVTGFSAGGFATALLTDDIIQCFPDCHKVTSYVDSGLMLNRDWHEITGSVWKAPQAIADRIHSDNITLDCLKALYEDHADRIRIAFSCSVRDEALSEYVRYVREGRLSADRQDGITFQRELKQMCNDLCKAIPDISLFIFDTPDANEKKKSLGLTKHCVGAADQIMAEEISCARWLWDVVSGKPKCVGLSLLENYPEGE